MLSLGIDYDAGHWEIAAWDEDVAAGLTGGPTAGLVQHLGLREARERVLDWIESPEPGFFTKNT